MKNVLVTCLASLIHKYYTDLKAGGVECRLVVPAPTLDLAIGLQATLVEEGLPSYLVVPRTREPSKLLRWIRPEAVTTVRQGDMIVVVCPGELSRIQDSVIGAGGAIRNFAFGDEWPWLDSGNEYFTFQGPVTSKIYSAWGVASDHVAAFDWILQEALLSSQDSLTRGTVFLDQIVGGFVADGPSKIAGEVNRFLFHLGIPLDPAVQWFDQGSVKKYFALCRRVLFAFQERVRAVGGKQELLERASELEFLPESTNAALSAIGYMIDRLSVGGDDAQTGLLSLYQCWESEDAWLQLPLPLLSQLLDVAPEGESVELVVAVLASPGYIHSDGKTAVLLAEGSLNIKGNYTGLSEGVNGAELVVCNRRSNPFLIESCTGGTGEFELNVTFDEIFGTGNAKKKNIKIAIVRGVHEIATGRIVVYRCDLSQPFVALFEPPAKVFLGQSAAFSGTDSSEEAEIINVKEPTALRIVVWDALSPPKLELDDDAVVLKVDSANSNLFGLDYSIDPSLNGSGRSRASLSGAGYKLVVDIEAKDVTRGEFTLERELMVRLSALREGNNKNAVSQLVDIFSGVRELPYAGLGGIDESSRSRIAFARLFESDSAGRPIVTNLLGAHSQTDTQSNPYIVSLLHSLPGAFQNVSISNGAAKLFDKYSAARIEAMSLLRNKKFKDSQWPAYAHFPTFIECRENEINNALKEYLAAYLNMLEFASSDAELSWAEKFTLTCADCVVHWNTQSATQPFLLIGPWHPIVLVKRFMVQAALMRSARRHLELKTDAKTHVLAQLLDQTEALRWFTVPAADNVTFESFYVASSSDPGWLLAFDHKTVGTPEYGLVVEKLRLLHGLETNLMPTSSEQIARGYLVDFLKAYPAKRAISVIADSTYSTQRLVESAHSLLYEKDEVSEIGRQLPGGIHIAVTSTEQIEEREWRSPPLCVYHVTDTGECADFRDVQLLSPGTAVATRAKEGPVTVPRGSNGMAVFTCPLREVGSLQNGTLISRSIERDTKSVDAVNLGGLFTNVCRILATIPGDVWVMNWKAAMPQRLERLWSVVPGNHVDPAVFIKYVTEAIRKGENAALWDYSMSLTGALNSYFVLSKIPQSISHELNKSPVLSKKPIAPAVLGELARVGVAMGSESLRSGSKALGVIGVVAAVRLFLSSGAAPSPIRNDRYLRGFLLPVDSFRELLGENLDSSDIDKRQRADLVGVQLGVLQDGTLAMSCCAIECKYTSTTFSYEQVLGALHQADSTLRRVDELVVLSKEPACVPERLALLSLISFGLRLSADHLPRSNEERQTEAAILEMIINGKIRAVAPSAGKIVVVTECGGQTASWAQSDGLDVRVCEGHWPGVSESEALQTVRGRLADEFSLIFELVNNSWLTPPPLMRDRRS
jgi:hypothetical protein